MKDSDIKSKFECISDWETLEPCRHDLDSMIVTEVDGKRYLLQKLDSTKYGGFVFSINALNFLVFTLELWKKKIGRDCYILGECGECY